MVAASNPPIDMELWGNTCAVCASETLVMAVEIGPQRFCHGWFGTVSLSVVQTSKRKGTEMEKAEPYRKVLKVMCIFSIVYDLLMIALFSIVAAGLFDYDTAALLLGLPQDMLGGVSLASAMQALGVMMIASQVIHLIGVLFVLHGVKHLAKMRPGIVLYDILSVFSIFALISYLVGGTPSSMIVGSYIAIWFMFYCTLRVNKMAKYLLVDFDRIAR